MISYFIAIFLFSIACFAKGEDGTVVILNQPNSTIRGRILKSFNGKDFYAFQEIPYAQPPVGSLRFQEPLAHTGWNGILNTTADTRICYQDWGGSEDCLVLNVFTPTKPGSENQKLPVYFYIHGGAFRRGYCNMSTCGPEYLMDYGVVLVTVLYRVGPFGFLTTEDEIIPGNIGLKDQLLALKWVNKNIAAFGGDPNQVTIGGQSAGGISTTCHVLSKKATGLFRGAVIESGTALIHGSYISTARNYAFQLGKLVQPSFNGTTSQELLKVLQSATKEDIQAASTKIKRVANQVGLLDDLNWGLVIESYGANPYMTKPFQQSLMEKDFEKVPILIGYTSEEILAFVTTVADIRTSAAIFDKNVTSLVYDKLHVLDKDLATVGDQLKKIYTNKTFVEDIAAYVGFSGDIGFATPVIRHAALSSVEVPVYLYQFSYLGEAHAKFNFSIPNVYGVAHTEELYYIFKQIDLNTEADQKLSKVVLKLWTNFIKFLNPTPEKSDPVLGNFAWPKVTNRNDVEYVNISDSLQIRSSPKKYKAVKNLYEKYAQPPFVIF